MPTFEFKSTMPCSAHDLFHYHQSPGAFTRLAPPWMRVASLGAEPGIEEGSRREMRIHKGPFFLTWVAEHRTLEAGLGFRDVQVRGPFRHWEHSHLFEPASSFRSTLSDRVEVTLPLGLPATPFRLEQQMERLFSFRHHRTRSDLARHAAFTNKPDNVLIAGRVDAFARDLAAFLSVGGSRVFRLRPERLRSGDMRFKMTPFFSEQACHPLDGADAVIHTGRSYDDPGAEEDAEMTYLCRAMEIVGQPPPLLLHLQGGHPCLDHYTRDPSLPLGQASRRTRETEASLAWRARLDSLFVRVVNLHFGELIRAPFGFLADLLLHLETFLFLGGGARSPHFCWISQDDAVAAVLHVLCSTSFQGDLAVVAPQTATRAELQQALVKRSLAAYTFNRMLKVLPGFAPGRDPRLDLDLDHMPQLAHRGFSFSCTRLGLAVGAALGDVELSSVID